ncbi:MAG: type III pantothenate kinase [Candidatus Omnitrophica bacterium]|nr:type III pantothenate kinase [Candidatus Omnitrophota bacterium]MDD5437442.1 type III pantothenate kinase [Candidatus Omnitrophota bacterium]
MKSALIAIDIGNTNITAGVFKAGRLSAKVKIPTCVYSKYESGLARLFKKGGLGFADGEAVIVSSVVPIALARLIMHLNRIARCRITVLGRDMQVPIKNLYRIKKEVGQDRLVNAYAAKVLYGAPAVVIDFGTAVTFDLVSKRGDYMGGLIMPGIGISLSSLYEKTALLPKVELKDAPHIIGKSTANSMRAGILYGFGAMCDGLVLKYRKVLGGSLKVIATGGNAGLIKKYSGSIRILDEDLTLKGLLLISQLKT